MYICVALRGDIPKSHKDFPVSDIAVATYASSVIPLIYLSALSISPS